MEVSNAEAQTTISAEQQATTTAAAEGTAPAQASSQAQAGTTGATAAPEKYELKIPEGSLLDQTWLDKIATNAKSRGLSNEQAQAEVNERSEMLSSFQGAQKAAMEKQSQAWLEQVKADKEIGGELFNKTAEVAKFAVDHFLGEDVKRFLDESGLGNHPALVKAFYKIGTEMRGDTFVRSGSAPGGQSKPIEDYFYGTKQT